MIGVEVVGREANCGGDSGAVVDGAEDWVVLLHDAEDALFIVLRWSEANGDGADGKVESDGLCVAQVGVVPVEPACSAERWVSGEFEFLLDSEDTDLDAAFVFDLGVAGEDEGGGLRD